MKTENQKIKVVSLPKDGKVCFECDGETIWVPLVGIRKCLDYIEHGAMLPHDSIINISIFTGFFLLRFEDTNAVFLSYDETAQHNVDINLTIGEMLDVLKAGWLIV